jgi:hypothetical protein
MARNIFSRDDIIFRKSPQWAEGTMNTWDFREWTLMGKLNSGTVLGWW